MIQETGYEVVLRQAQQLPRSEQAKLISALAQRLSEVPVSERPNDKMAILAQIRQRLHQSGEVLPTVEEIQSSVQAERDSWDDR